MFIELTRNGNKHLLPLSSISVHQEYDGRILVKCKGLDLFVDESYETIREMIIDLLENENGKAAWR